MKAKLSMVNSISWRLPILACLAVSLAGCNGGDFDDLKSWMAESSQGLRGKVDPLPEVKPYQPFLYTAYDLVDPFNAAKMDVSKKSSLSPNVNRPKEALENYDLEQLLMVGTIQKGKDIQALVQTPDNNLFRVKVGSYMGQNFGMVTEVSDTQVKLKEIVEDSGGDWIERASVLTLRELEQK